MNYLSQPEEEKIKLFTSTLVETNRAFNFYVDWSKPEKVKEEYNIEFNILNALIKTKNYDSDFKKILKKMPTVVNLFPLLFCLGKAEIKELKKDKKTFKVLNTSNFDDSKSKLDDVLLEYRFNIKENEQLTDEQIENYLEFTNKIGLKYLFENILEKHVVDYVSGCEVGIDTNARKNRGGIAFELALEPVISEITKANGITLLIQKQFKALKDIGFEVSEDIENRKADFILVKGRTVMNIEVNFFNGGGSKPEEIVDSYINRQNDLSDNGIEFMLVTDGIKCWGNSEKSQLKKGFRHLNYICNYKMASNGYLKEVINKEFK